MLEIGKFDLDETRRGRWSSGPARAASTAPLANQRAIQALLLVNEPTLIPVLLPLAPSATALARATDHIATTMTAYGASDTLSPLNSARCAPAGSDPPPTATSSGS